MAFSKMQKMFIPPEMRQAMEDNHGNVSAAY